MSMIVGGSSTAFACICGVNMPSATRSIPSGAKPRSVGRSWLVVTMIEVPTGCQVPLSFYLGKYEVTQSQWQVVMGNNPSRFQGDNLPVEQMSWEDVQTFIRKLNAREGEDTYRLPTEAEWEYAARAGSTTAYSFGHSDSRLGDIPGQRAIIHLPDQRILPRQHPPVREIPCATWRPKLRAFTTRWWIDGCCHSQSWGGHGG